MNASLPDLAGVPPSNIPRDAIIMQKQAEAVLIWTIGAFCILSWEFIICLPDEYRLIWRKPMNTSSLLYLCNRYFGLVEFCLVASLSTDVWTPSACKRIFFFEPVSGLISTVMSQMILGCRVYAIFGRNKSIGIVLCLSLMAEIVFSGMAISHVSPPPRTKSSPPSAQPPCGSIYGPFEWLVVFWAMPLFYDTIVFLLTAWKAFDFWRKDVDTHLFEVIWHDGFLYFFAILFMNIANVVIFLTAPRILRAVNIGPTLMFQVIISCRLVLNLKSSGSQTTSASKSLKARSKTRQINVEVTPVTVNKSTWDSKEKSHHVKLPSRGDFAASKKLQQLRNKDPTARNWSLPAPLWNKESSGSMV